ncbi:MAG: HAMP domain-containing histidine kinase [Anaerolineaceae bacterium]|nr:HAMP domain-containing histidine kinase [Anaerolineaceae bacterium]
MMPKFLRNILHSETASALLENLAQFPPNEGCDIIALRRCVFDEQGIPRLEPEAFWSRPGVVPWKQTIHVDDESLAQLWILSDGPPMFIESRDSFVIFTSKARQFHEEQGITALYHILVRRNEEVSAVISVLWRTPHTFSDEYRAVIEFTSWVLGPVVENIFLRHQNQALTTTIKVLEQRLLEKETELQLLVHDLKQPITSIISATNLLNGYIDRLGKDQIAAKLQHISEASWGMNDWITSILLLAQIRNSEQVETTPVSMLEALNSAIRSLQDLLDRVSATVQVGNSFDSLPLIQANPTWVQHIWANFISNACKYGGSPPLITFSGTRLDGTVQFTVQDNGQGIPPEKQNLIFEPFTRLETHALKKSGTGVGLTTAKLLVEKLGGEVGVISDTGGSTFWFTLRVSPGVPAA